MEGQRKHLPKFQGKLQLLEGKKAQALGRRELGLS